MLPFGLKLSAWKCSTRRAIDIEVMRIEIDSFNTSFHIYNEEDRVRFQLSHSGTVGLFEHLLSPKGFDRFIDGDLGIFTTSKKRYQEFVAKYKEETGADGVEY